MRNLEKSLRIKNSEKSLRMRDLEKSFRSREMELDSAIKKLDKHIWIVNLQHEHKLESKIDLEIVIEN